ncbi:unnamed protein product [Ceutorhynchus assimilis]|uniref:Uncharacterized protein n=1 Tax=Ceutorhynchus assimilis TaxID=467358 RepID=A0A9N9QIU1_9CUCU|nr:unnamed protein product [Ceutorhynchus assimilis]
MVLVKDYRNRSKIAWTKAKLIKKTGKAKFLCELEEGNIWTRHKNQIKICQWEAESKNVLFDPNLTIFHDYDTDNFEIDKNIITNNSSLDSILSI